MCVGDIKPEDLEEEVISTQPQADYQAIGDTQADVVSVEIETNTPLTLPTEETSIESGKQTDDHTSSSSNEETPPIEDQSRNLIPVEQGETTETTD